MMFPKELTTRLKNVHAFAVTPFQREDPLRLDLDGLARNLEFLIERGVHVINVGGGTGEIDALTDAELLELARKALETAGDRALILPTVPGNLRAAVELAPKLEALGARAVLGMAPFMRQAVPEDLEGVYRFYSRLAEASGLALMPYNTQGWPAEFFERLAEIDPVIGVKDPCHQPHNLFRAIRLLGDRFVWIGNKRHDAGVIQYRYQAGIHGFTAGIINFAPEHELEIHRAALKQDWPRIVKLQDRLAPLERLRSAHGDVAMIKAAMDLTRLAGGPVRPPRVDVSPEGRAAIERELQRLATNA